MPLRDDEKREEDMEREKTKEQEEDKEREEEEDEDEEQHQNLGYDLALTNWHLNLLRGAEGMLGDVEIHMDCG